MTGSRLAAILGRAVALVVLAALASVALLRLAPGYRAGEEWLDVRRDASRRVTEEPLPTLILQTIGRFARGDLGRSELLQQPVAALLAERWQVTAVGVAGGLILSWLLALSGALMAVRLNLAWLDVSSLAGAGLLQCLPAALIGLLLLATGSRGAGLLALGITLVLSPRLYRMAYAILAQAQSRDCVRSAQARGIGPWRLLLRHVVTLAAAPLGALAGVSVAQALGAAIPLEMVLDVPGLGQLAWQAALARDLPLLVALTTLMGLASILANAVPDAAAGSQEAS
jgi:peptide/nickel transport system permease protein